MQRVPVDTTDLTEDMLAGIAHEASKPGSVFSGRIVQVLVDRVLELSERDAPHE